MAKTAIIQVSTPEEKTFESVEDLVAYLRLIEQDSQWEECSSDCITFSENPSGVPFAGFGGDEFECVCFSPNIGLTNYPLRYTALQSILARAECYGNGIKRLFLSDKAKFAEHLNDYFSLKDGRQAKMKALLQDGKLSALHSGSYTPIPMEKVFLAVNDFVEDFEETKFTRASWTWEKTESLYRISDSSITDTYTKLVGKYMPVFNKNLQIELLAISSDVAEAAVRFYPRYIVDGHEIPISGGAAVKHIGKVTIETVENRLYNVFASFEASCRNLAGLGDIELNNKKNVMIKAFTILNVPQKYGAEIVERYDNTKTTALEVYTSMCEVLRLMRGKLDKFSVLNYEDNLSRLITWNRSTWKRIDISGVVAWSAKGK